MSTRHPLMASKREKGNGVVRLAGRLQEIALMGVNLRQANNEGETV